MGSESLELIPQNEFSLDLYLKGLNISREEVGPFLKPLQGLKQQEVAEISLQIEHLNQVLEILVQRQKALQLEIKSVGIHLDQTAVEE